MRRTCPVKRSPYSAAKCLVIPNQSPTAGQASRSARPSQGSPHPACHRPRMELASSHRGWCVCHDPGTGRGGRVGRAPCQPPVTADLSRAGGAEAVDLRSGGVGGQPVRSVLSGRGKLAGASGASVRLTAGVWSQTRQAPFLFQMERTFVLSAANDG